MELMTIDEVAEKLKVSRSTVFRLVRYHNMPQVKVSRIIRFDCEEIERWLKTLQKSRHITERTNTEPPQSRKETESIDKKKHIKNLCLRIRDEVLQKNLLNP